MAKTREIVIQYAPRRWAMDLHDAVQRWLVLVIHRRGGKTTAAFNHLQRKALENKDTRYAYIAPTFKQAKRIVWGMAKYYARDIPGVDFNESELLIKYPNGSEIMLLGSDNPDSIRGIALWGVYLDEYPQQSPIVFTEVVSKCLADHLGFCIFGGTPKGKGHFFRIYQVAQKDPEWCLVYRTIDQSLKNEEGETIENLRQALEDDKKLVKQGLMTQDEFQQEWYNSFEASVRGAVYLKQLAFLREKGHIKGISHDPTLPVFTVWDLGISKSDAMAVGFFQRSGREIYMIDYIESIGTGLPHMIKTVKEKSYIYGKHFAPHDIRNKEQGTGKTRLDTASALGIDFDVVGKMSIEDGIDLARAMMMRMWIDNKNCEVWLDLIGSYHYDFDEAKGMLTKFPVHDYTSHAADMIRYAAIAEDDMLVDEKAPAPRTRDDVAASDEYVGQVDPDEDEDGEKRHPMLRGVDLGKMGHKR